MNELNDDNFLIFAIKHYQNPSCTGMAELEDDLKRFKYLKRLFNRYEKTGEPNERLIINHLVLLYNVFGKATTDMLFHKLEEKYSGVAPEVFEAKKDDDVDIDEKKAKKKSKNAKKN